METKVLFRDKEGLAYFLPNLKNGRMRPILLAAALLVAAAADPVVAERGTDHITASQARALIAAADPQQRQRLAATPAAVTELLRNALIQRAIVRQAQAEHWDQRADVAALLARTHDQLVAQSYLAAHAPIPPGYPSDADLQAAYDHNKSQFMQPRGYHLAQLYVPKSATPPADTQKHLAALRQQITHGKLTLDAAARQIPGATASDLGWLTEAQLVPAVRPAISGLLEGALTDPVCTPAGCHLIRLIATRPAGPAPLPELKDSLVRALREQKLAEQERVYASGLLAKQPVAINEIELSRLAR